MDIEKKVRPIYEELQGMLSQAPDPSGGLYEQEQSLWDNVNRLVDKLVETTEDNDYTSFKINPQYSDGSPYVSVTNYRGKISGLISKLYGTYFSDEDRPFGGSPKTIMTQNTSVDIQLYVQLGAELQSALSKAKTKEEKGFIEAIKGKIGTVKSYIDFLLLVTSTAKQFKIGLDRILDLFGKG